VEFVIVPLPEDRVVECYEAGFDNGGFAMMATVCEFLPSAKVCKMPHIMVIQMAIRPSVKLVTADMLQQLSTLPTHEALRVPSLTHSTDNTADDGVGAAGTDDGGRGVDTRDCGTRLGRRDRDGGDFGSVKRGYSDSRQSGKDDTPLVVVADTDRRERLECSRLGSGFDDGRWLDDHGRWHSWRLDNDWHSWRFDNDGWGHRLYNHRNRLLDW